MYIYGIYTCVEARIQQPTKLLYVGHTIICFSFPILLVAGQEIKKNNEIP